MRTDMDMKTAREVAARVWCDPEMWLFPMDPDLAEALALLIMLVANRYEAGQNDEA
jgi:hypothetical protein